MRELHYFVAISLDGFIAEKDGTFGRFVGDGQSVQDYLQSLHHFGAVVMGRKTYEVGLNAGVTNPYPFLDSYVFSTSMTASPDPAVTLVQENAVQKVRELKKQEGKPIYLCGGGNFASQLMEHGIIDKIIVKINPLLMGEGIPLFGSPAATAALELEKETVYNDGCCWLFYNIKR